MDTKTLLQDGDIQKDSGDLIFNPFNFKNKEITESEVCDILKKYGVPDKVHNLNLYVNDLLLKTKKMVLL
jgi:hypothetical protein